jgi:hypothetical protein
MEDLPKDRKFAALQNSRKKGGCMGSQSVGRQLVFTCALACTLVLSSCGGSKVLEEPEPFSVTTKPLATASDQRLTATLDWVIVRDGPGTWAKNANWDEYLIRVRNLSEEPIRVIKVVVFDSLGTQIKLGGYRWQLVEGSKETARRYKDKGLKVKAGEGAEALLVAGGVITYASTVVGLSVLAGSYSTAAASAAVGGIIIGPALLVGGAVGGMIQSKNNKDVDDQIDSRQTLLPAVLREEQEQRLDLFFPLAPSPRQIEITYVDSRGEYTLILDTQVALDAIHLGPADK